MRINLHSKMANRSMFFNMGIFLASVMMALAFAAGGKDVSDAALLPPFIAFAISAIFAFVASQRSDAGLDIIRDGGALPIFLVAYLASGNTRPWLYIMLGLSVVLVVIITMSKKHADYEEDDDIYHIR